MVFWGWLMSLLGDSLLFALHLSGKTSFPKPLSTDDEKRLVAEMIGGDMRAREKLIVHNLRLVAHIARKFTAPGMDSDDLVSIGAIGLIKGVNTFKPDAGRLTAYISRCIENEILMYLRACKKAKGTVSLNDAIGTDGDGNEVRLIDLLSDNSGEVSDKAEVSIESERALRMLGTVLDDRERRVIMLRYGLADGEPRPQHTVADLMGISRSYVSRIEKQALLKLRNAMQ